MPLIGVVGLMWLAVIIQQALLIYAWSYRHRASDKRERDWGVGKWLWEVNCRGFRPSYKFGEDAEVLQVRTLATTRCQVHRILVTQEQQCASPSYSLISAPITPPSFVEQGICICFHAVFLTFYLAGLPCGWDVGSNCDRMFCPTHRWLLFVTPLILCNDSRRERQHGPG